MKKIVWAVLIAVGVLLASRAAHGRYQASLRRAQGSALVAHTQEFPR